MNLIERSNPNNLQSYLTSSSCDDKKLKTLIKLNLISRLFQSIKDDLNEDDIKSNILPNLNIKIVKLVSNTNPDKKIYMGNLNLPKKDSEKESKPISGELNKMFSDIGIELPNEYILRSRLDQFSDSDVTDPIRLTTFDSHILDVESKDIELSQLESSHFEFIDTFYASAKDRNTIAYYEKVKASCILTLDEVLRDKPSIIIDDKKFDEMLSDIKDDKVKDDIKQDLSIFLSNRSVRSKMVKDANLILNQEEKVSKSKPIATWKLVTGISIVLLSALAYSNRKILSKSFSVAKNTKGFEGNRFRNFFKFSFTKKGREGIRSIFKAESDNKNWRNAKRDAPNKIRDIKSNIKLRKSDYKRSKNIANDFLNQYINRDK